MELLRFIYSQSRRMLLGAIAAGTVSGVANVGLLAIVGSAVGNAGRHVLVAPFVALCIVAPLARFASQTLVVYLVQGALVVLRMELAHSIVSVPLTGIEQIGSHRITAAFTEDITRLSNSMGIVPIMFINLGAVLSCVAYMMWLNIGIFTYLLLFIVCGLVSYQLALRRSLRYIWSARRQEDEVHRHLRTFVTGIKELKLHRERRRALLDLVLRPAMLDARRNHVIGMRIFTLAAGWGELLLFLALGVLVFLLSTSAFATPKVIVSFSFALLYMIGPLEMLMNSLPELGRAGVAVHNLNQMGLLLRQDSESSGEFDAGSGSALAPLLEARGIVYEHRSDGPHASFVVGPLDLRIDAGELVFITGGNGSGKTTLAKVLTGLYEPHGGRVLLRGVEVVRETRDAYRQNFSAVFADSVIFDSLLGLDTPDLDERAQRYLAELQLDGKVEIRGGVFSTTNLSQGQRKRLALLTACLEDRPIYFFDEWAADQDPVFRRVFYEAILPDLRRRGKTTIVISHDDRYYHVADRVLKLDGGRITSEDNELDHIPDLQKK
jgi:putative ATP-binding cassette transporter